MATAISYLTNERSAALLDAAFRSCTMQHRARDTVFDAGDVLGDLAGEGLVDHDAELKLVEELLNQLLVQGLLVKVDKGYRLHPNAVQ